MGAVFQTAEDLIDRGYKILEKGRRKLRNGGMATSGAAAAIQKIVEQLIELGHLEDALQLAQETLYELGKAGDGITKNKEHTWGKGPPLLEWFAKVVAELSRELGLSGQTGAP